MIEHLARNIKIAAKSVFFHYRQYLSFFVALFVIQTLIGVASSVFDNAIETRRRSVYGEYDYHLLLKNLNSDQYVYLVNGGNAVFTDDLVYEITETVERADVQYGTKAYDIYLRFTGDDPNADYARFKERFGTEMAMMSEDGLRYTTTPVLRFDSYESVNTWAFVGAAAIIILLSTALLTALYNIRVSHYKFTFGIYMTFGADFKKLFETSFWEMMLIALAAVIPSSLASALIGFIIVASRGGIFVFRFATVIKLLVMSAAVAAAAVIWPIWRVSRRYPNELIVAEDNSNLVISPSVSFEMYGASFPRKYERFTLWRFRRYIAQLLLTATVFAALFVTLSALSSITVKSQANIGPQFNLSLANGLVYDGAEMKEELYAMEGVSFIGKAQSVDAAGLQSHVLVESSNCTFFSNLVIYDGAASKSEAGDGDYNVSNDISFCPCDEEVIAGLLQYKCDGSLYDVLDGGNMVIVSDSIANGRKFTLKPGDKIKVAVYRDRIRGVDDLTGRELLKAQLKYYYFDYVEFTVAAVLRDNPTYVSAPFYFSAAGFESITGAAPAFTSIDIYTDGLDTDGERTLEEALRDWGALYGDGAVTVTNTHASSEHAVTVGSGYDALFSVAAVLILIISPLIWYFSQLIFYGKRENELYILEMLGGTSEKLRGIYIIDGIFLTCAASLSYILLGIGGTLAIFKLMSKGVARFSLDYTSRYDFNLPILPFILGLVLTAAFAFTSSYLLYILYQSRRRKVSIAEETGERG